MPFPSSPNINDIYTEGTTAFLWDGDKWTSTPDTGSNFAIGPVGATGPKGDTGPAADVSFFEQRECSQPYIVGIDSDDKFQNGGFTNNSVTDISKKSWQFTRIGNQVTLTGLIEMTGSPVYQGANGDLALYFDPPTNPFADKGPPAPYTPNRGNGVIDHPFTACAAIKTASTNNNIGWYSYVPNSFERTLTLDGPPDQVVVQIFQKRASFDNQLGAALTQDLDDNFAKLFINVTYFTDDRAYGGERPF